MLDRRYLALALLLLGVGHALAADDPLAVLERVDADPLELARVVDGLSSDAVLDALGKPAAVRRRLALVRAAPWIDGAERALLPLVQLMSGRDSLLAPAAALAVARIVADLGDPARRAGEAVHDELKPARRAMLVVVDAQHVRQDIRGVAAEAIGACDDWLGPLPAVPEQPQ